MGVLYSLVLAMGHDLAEKSSTAGALAGNMLLLFYVMNVGLAGTNLLPLLPMDGGQVALLAIEKYGGRHARKISSMYQFASFVLFLLLIIGIFAGDLARIIPRP